MNDPNSAVIDYIFAPPFDTEILQRSSAIIRYVAGKGALKDKSLNSLLQLACGSIEGHHQISLQLFFGLSR